MKEVLKTFNKSCIERCEYAKHNDAEYMKAERGGTVSQEELQAMSELICYKQAIADLLELQKAFH